MDDFLQPGSGDQSYGAASDGDEVLIAPGVQHLVDGFARGAEKGGELGLGDPDPATISGDPVIEKQEALGEPRLHLELQDNQSPRSQP